jgi:phytoene dehydrogenase-like protein
MFGSHYATRAPMRFAGADGEVTPSAVGIMPSVDRALRLGSDIARGKVALDTPPLLAICSSAADPSRAPAGHHTMKLMGFHPYNIEGGAQRWDDIRDEVDQAHLDHLLSFDPGFTRDDILARYIKSPLDLERINPANWQGSCHAGASDPSQSGPLRPVPGWAQHRMPIDGLYQTGASTHPGGSVSAGPGRNAAQVMLADFGLDMVTGP